jgi:hypothetical protein
MPMEIPGGLWRNLLLFSVFFENIAGAGHYRMKRNNPLWKVSFHHR